MIFHGILYFFTLEVLHLGKTQNIKKNPTYFSSSSYVQSKKLQSLIITQKLQELSFIVGGPFKTKDIIEKMLHSRHFDMYRFKKIILYSQLHV